MFMGWLQEPGEKMSPIGDQNENMKKMGSPEVSPTGEICSHTCCVHLFSVYTQSHGRQSKGAQLTPFKTLSHSE